MSGVNFISQDDARRKGAPMFRGLLGYFPAALFEVAEHSRESNDKHNPGEDLHWARGKSSDHPDCIVRHLIDAGKKGTPNRKYHLRALAWRALALLQEECEAEGSEPGVSCKFPEPTTKEKLQDLVVRTPSGAHVLISHPAQKLAVEAFKAEQVGEQLAAAGYDRFASLKGGTDGE